MTLPKELIQRFVRDSFFHEGLALFEKGQVLSAECIAGSKVNAIVSEGGKKTYRQTVSLFFAKSGGLNSIQGLCTCTVGYNCKHVAAALLATAEDIESPEPPQAAVSNGQAGLAPKDAATPALHGWLDRLKCTDRALTENTEVEIPDRIKERIFYVIGQDKRRRITVTPIKGGLKRAGEIGAGARPYNFGNLDFHDPPQFVQPADLRIFRMLQAYGLGTRNPGYRSQDEDAEDLQILLTKAVSTGRARWREMQGPAMHEGGSRKGSLQWSEQDDGSQQLVVHDSTGLQLQVLPTAPPSYFHVETGAFGRLNLDLPPRLSSALLLAPAVPAEAAYEVAEALKTLKSGAAPLPSTLHVEERKGRAPTPVLTLFTLPARQQRSPYHDHGAQAVHVPAIRISFDYEGHEAAAFPPEDPQFVEAGKLIRLKRNLPAEKKLLARLDDCGAKPLDAYRYLKFGDSARDGDRAFPDSDRFEDWVFGENREEARSQGLSFTAEKLPLLKDEGWRVEIAGDWPYRIYDGPLTVIAGIEQGSGVDWFSFTASAEAEGQKLDLLPIVLSVLEILPLEEGGLPEDFDLEEFLDELVLYPDLPDGGLLRLEGETLIPIVTAFVGIYGLGGEFHRAEAGKVAGVADSLAASGLDFKGAEQLKELGGKLRGLTDIEALKAPKELKGQLRPYQAAGFSWLAALSKTGFGGCLADDMGLGKTVQTLCLLLQRHLVEGSERPSLLVVPTSLVHNWMREATRFAPDLKLLVLHGGDRKAYFKEIPDNDLIVTTYPLIHRDHAVLFEQEFELAILDEAQAVKNPTSNAAKRIRQIKARQRIALTGTPIENNLQELWSLYDWLIPGLLGDAHSFKENFRTPIEKQGQQATQLRLNSRIRPFMLRRTKEEVAKDLPPKTEITELVPLDGDQRSLYESLRTAMDKRVRDAIRSKGLNGSRITILDALLKLRQVCCDPGLVKLEAARKVAESAKRQRLMEMLEELVGEDRRILVFSQFVEMLKLIEGDIKERGWGYVMLTGQTKNRNSAVQKFQSGKVPVFLVSLKAGGVGLNLTAADTVILYDPWWNPAVERQAMDRAHRIGQDKPVFVYRMVADGTVESAIQELQAKKQALADALFEGTDRGPLNLTEDDLAALFKPL
ncbi:MAG: DEAD/DEAH box helicase [Rhodospirillales bacterium]|nr:DEAD/DEAH box helicase [Rhodospirillales bacterium]